MRVSVLYLLYETNFYTPCLATTSLWLHLCKAITYACCDGCWGHNSLRCIRLCDLYHQTRKQLTRPVLSSTIEVGGSTCVAEV
ncbi:unnamed protein product [Amoebophrya sp. A120]|nr:unnamed protein product [Amoebophrya sp. A120]|eukprot:GSA120T00023773001.1